MSARGLLDAPSCWTDEHSLAHCEGYRIISDDGPIGYVEAIEAGADDRPENLLVRVGEQFSCLVSIPVKDVANIDAVREEIFVGWANVADWDDVERQRRLPFFV